MCLSLPGNLPEITCRTKYLGKAPCEPKEEEEGLKQKLTMLTKYVNNENKNKNGKNNNKMKEKTHVG